MLATGVDVAPLALALKQQPHLWNADRERTGFAASPHSDADDIWLRYNDARPYRESGDFSTFSDPHEAVWYPAAYALPQIRPIVFALMARVEGERLGGVLITRIPPGGRIAPHTDSSWHVDTFEKYYVSIESAPGALFICEDEQINPNPGDVYWFDNRRMHSVENNSTSDRITLIVCIERHKWEKSIK